MTMKENFVEHFMICTPDYSFHYNIITDDRIEYAREQIDNLNAKHVVRHEPLEQYFICSVETRTRYAEDGTFVSKDEFTTVLEKYPDADQCG